MMTTKTKKNHANSLTFRNEETFQVFFYLQEEIKQGFSIRSIYEQKF